MNERLIYVIPGRTDRTISALDRTMLREARLLAESTGCKIAVLPLLGGGAVDWSASGADFSLSLAHIDLQPEQQLAWLDAFTRRDRPIYVIGSDTIPGPGDLLRRLAARRKLRFAAAVTQLLQGPWMQCGNDRALAFERHEPMVLACVLGNDPASTPTDSPMDRPICQTLPPLDFEPVSARRLQFERESTIDRRNQCVADAEFVVAGGDGVKDWASFHNLCAILNASEGASRVVCDAGIMPKHSQVGSSGVSASARCYLAFGISGAPQHLEGIEACEHVIAVNTDAHAPIMRRADLAIVGDAQKVMRELIARLQSHAERPI